MWHRLPLNFNKTVILFQDYNIDNFINFIEENEKKKNGKNFLASILH
jgi:hypothetical protein